MHNPANKIPLREFVKQELHKYFLNLDGGSCKNIYELVLTEVEQPLLEIIMQYTAGNQSKAAKWLGVSRNTLRKLLKKYNLMPNC